MTDLTAPNLAYDVEGLEQLAEETGDYRFKRAAEALRELHREDARRSAAWPDLVKLMATRFAADLRSTRAKAIRIDNLARHYTRGDWLLHRNRLRLPAEIKGTPGEIVWRIAKDRGCWPSVETVRKILDGRYRPDLA